MKVGCGDHELLVDFAVRAERIAPIFILRDFTQFLQNYFERRLAHPFVSRNHRQPRRLGLKVFLADVGERLSARIAPDPTDLHVDRFYRHGLENHYGHSLLLRTIVRP